MHTIDRSRASFVVDDALTRDAAAIIVPLAIPRHRAPHTIPARSRVRGTRETSRRARTMLSRSFRALFRRSRRARASTRARVRPGATRRRGAKTPSRASRRPASRTETSEPSSAVHRNLLESRSVSRTTPSIERATSTASRNMKPIDPTVRFTNLQAPNPRAGSIRHQRTSRGQRTFDRVTKNHPKMRAIVDRRMDVRSKKYDRDTTDAWVTNIESISSMTGVSIVSSPRPRSRARARSRVRLRLQGASRRVASRRAHAMALSLAQVAPAAQVRRVSHRRARRARLSASRTRARRRERRRRSASDRMAIGASSRVDARPGRDDARRRRRAREKSTTADARVTDERFRGAVFFA